MQIGACAAEIAAGRCRRCSGSNPEDEEERIKTDLEPGIPKRRQGESTGGGNEVKEEDQSERGLSAGLVMPTRSRE